MKRAADLLACADRASRGDSDWIWIEGARAVAGAARTIPLEAIVVTPGTQAPRLPAAGRLEKRVPVVTWKGKGRGPFRAETPQGVGAVARRPAAISEDAFFRARRFLLLDGVQIPGNVGALARTAVALGVERVVALGDTADPLGPLALRASAGYAVAIPVLRSRRRAEVFSRFSSIGSGGPAIVSASTRGGDWPPPRLDSWALVLGSEARGTASLPPDARLVTIPIAPGVESLGVAAAGSILLSALSGGGTSG